MSLRKPTAHSDIRGAARLAVDATAGLTDLVEAMHQRIASAPGATAADGRTSGITGLVYQSIRGVTKLVGGSVDGLLGLLEPLLAPPAKVGDGPAGPIPAPQPQREAIVATLNGVLGDHLAATHNPLATAMTLRHAGQPLALDRAALQARFPKANGRVIVLLHGLCMNDLQWLREGHDHGAALAAELDATPLYLHYNSGLSIPDNGRLFAGLMAQLLAAWPAPVERLVLLGHSMGGLVARSALAQAPTSSSAAGQAWPQRVTELLCLGTPHFGARLERAGHGVDLLLAASPYAAPLARLGKVRSAGITDLRHGRVRPVPAGGKASDAEAPLPLPDFPHGPRCYAIAGCLGASSKSLQARLAGDGLVTVASALGQHKDSARALHFAPERQWLAQGVGHLALLSDAGVYAQLRAWLRPPANRAGGAGAAH
jgi:pimeloyl-ACP methyl ester carboxylesterase